MGLTLRRLRTTILATTLALFALGAGATTFTVVNGCNQTIYPAIYPADYQNGGWSMTPNTSVTFTVPTNYNGRVWARKNCNTASPAQCDTGQCGGTGLQCAGTTGQPSTALAEFNLDAGGTTDWYDVSDVDAYDFPMGLTMSNGQGYEPTAVADVLAACPPNLQKKDASGTIVSCANPCSVDNTALICCTNLNAQQCRDIVNEWPADAQQYVNDIHNNTGEVYTYPWDDWWGLHTVATGSNWTITFCPNNVQPGPGPVPDNWPLAPTNAAGSSSSGHVTLTWGAISGATSYNVYRSLNGGGSNGTAQDTPYSTGLTNATFTDNNVTNGTTYYYIVTALNSAGFSAPSHQIIVTASGTGGGGVPSPPTNLAASPGNAQVTLSWTASSGATSYKVTRNGAVLAPVISASPYTDTGLTNGTTYTYTVAAVNSSGTSGPSNQASATPVSGGGGGGSISINCGGAATSPFVADTDFAGGTTSSTTHAVDTTQLTAPVPPQAVLQTNRHGGITYTIGNLSGSHTVTLYFEEHYWNAAGARIFNVSINGTQVLTNFDIFATAGGQFKAIQRSFTASANGSGQIVITFTTVKDNAMVNGIAIK